VNTFKDWNVNRLKLGAAFGDNKKRTLNIERSTSNIELDVSDGH